MFQAKGLGCLGGVRLKLSEGSNLSQPLPLKQKQTTTKKEINTYLQIGPQIKLPPLTLFHGQAPSGKHTSSTNWFWGNLGREGVGGRREAGGQRRGPRRGAAFRAGEAGPRPSQALGRSRES